MRVQCSGFRVQGSGFRVQGSGFREEPEAEKCEEGRFAARLQHERFDRLPVLDEMLCLSDATGCGEDEMGC